MPRRSYTGAVVLTGTICGAGATSVTLAHHDSPYLAFVLGFGTLTLVGLIAVLEILATTEG